MILALDSKLMTLRQKSLLHEMPRLSLVYCLVIELDIRYICKTDVVK